MPDDRFEALKKKRSSRSDEEDAQMGRVAWFDVLCFAGIVSLHLLHVLAHVARVVLALPERIYSSLVGDRDDFVGSKSDRPLTHFAVAWTSPRPLVTRLRGEAYARGILLDDLDLLIRWCRLHGVQCLSLYDEDGPSLARSLSRTLPIHPTIARSYL